MMTLKRRLNFEVLFAAVAAGHPLRKSVGNIKAGGGKTTVPSFFNARSTAKDQI
jgi:hypothetical protein